MATGSSKPLYLPVMPRSAISFSAKVVAEQTSASGPVIFPSAAIESDLAPTEVGRLPVVQVQLKANEGAVSINVDKIGFSAVDRSVGGNFDWSTVMLEWTDPRPLDAKGQLLDPATPGPLTLLRFNNPFSNEAAATSASLRRARYLGRSTEPVSEVALGDATLRYRIRRNTSEHGCQWYLLEAAAPLQQHVQRMLGSLPVDAQDSCTSWFTVREQVRSIAKSGSVLRLLLHVDF